MNVFPLLTVILLSTILLLPGCQQHHDPDHSSLHHHEADSIPETLKLHIQEKTKRFTEAHLLKDTTYLNQIFTRDARIYPPHSGMITGRAAIAKLNADWVNYDIHEFRETSVALYGSNGILIDEGTYFLQYGTDSVTDEGHYINIWKTEDGEWKIGSNIWNSNLPELSSGITDSSTP